MTTPYINSKGLVMPYALGWFSEQVAGLQCHWGYGFGDSHAALLIRVPEKNLSFILLSNGGLPTGAVRMGSGHLLQSAFAISFIKHFVLAGQSSKHKIDYSADPATLKQAFLKFRPGKNDSIYYEQLIAEALYDRFIETEMSGTANKAKQLVQLLYEINPGFFSNYYPSLIYLLSDLHSEDLRTPTEKAIRAYRLSGYFHPEVIQNIINYYVKTKQEDKALEYYHMLADSKGFEERGDVIQACAYLGRFYVKNNNTTKGREYLWRCILLAKQAGYKNPFIEERVAEMNKN